MQAQARPVMPEALEAIVSRAVVLLMHRLDGQAPHLVVALLPGLLHTMLAAFLEVLAEERESS